VREGLRPVGSWGHTAEGLESQSSEYALHLVRQMIRSPFQEEKLEGIQEWIW